MFSFASVIYAFAVCFTQYGYCHVTHFTYRNVEECKAAAEDQNKIWTPEGGYMRAVCVSKTRPDWNEVK